MPTVPVVHTTEPSGFQLVPPCPTPSGYWLRSNYDRRATGVPASSGYIPPWRLADVRTMASRCYPHLRSTALATAVHSWPSDRSEEHTSELQSPCNLVCRLLLEKKTKNNKTSITRTRKCIVAAMRRSSVQC